VRSPGDRDGLGPTQVHAARRFPDRFFDRVDDTPDVTFYSQPRLVTHIDDAAIAALGSRYRELAIGGSVLDLMSSWVSHFAEQPRRLTVLGMNDAELRANPAADGRVCHDLNETPGLPFASHSFDDITCCVSVDYLKRPVEVFAEVGRVLRPGGRFVVSISNRCFPTKAISGWMATDDRGHVEIVRAYFDACGAFGTPVVRQIAPESGGRGDLLVTVHASMSTPSARPRWTPDTSR
jgi:SAM-dependent methyltransferase